MQDEWRDLRLEGQGGHQPVHDDLQDQQRDRKTSNCEPGGWTVTDGEDEWWIV
jgi:hypothetical protein